MALSAKSLAGPGYVILNILRAMNIVGLLAVMAASILMIIKITIVSKFFVFDAISHGVIVAISTFLIVSELSLFYPYFARNWPLLSVEHGFVALGTTMFILGVDLLGSLNKPASTKETLGTAFWRIVAGSGLIAIVLGGLNCIASFVFRAPAMGITARHVRMDGAIALTTGPRTPVVSQFSGNSLKSPPFPGVSSPYASPNKNLSVCTSFPFNRNSEACDDETPRSSSSRWRLSSFRALTTPIRQASETMLPIFHDKSRSGEKDIKMEGKVIEKKVDIVSISGPMNVNPQFAHLVQPPPQAAQRDRNGSGHVRNI